MSRHSDYSSRDEKKSRVPRWIPVALLTVASVALTVPAVLLWRQKRALGVQTSPLFGRKSVKNAPIPVRRRIRTNPGISAETHSSLNSGSKLEKAPTLGKLSPVTQPQKASPSSDVRSGASDGSLASLLFDGPLVSLGALGIATGVVGVATMVGIWGVKRSLGVQNVEEFATEVRRILLSHFPALSQGIYRTPCETDEPLLSESSSESSIASNVEGQIQEDWSWDGAEKRLSLAFDRGGIGEWAECAAKEMEEESKIERSKRGL